MEGARRLARELQLLSLYLEYIVRNKGPFSGLCPPTPPKPASQPADKTLHEYVAQGGRGVSASKGWKPDCLLPVFSGNGSPLR